MKKNMVFAIFGDGQFIAYTYGLFMQLTKKPKMYMYSENQIGVVTKNFISKIRDIKKELQIDFNNPYASALVNGDQNKDKKKLSDFTNFELRMYRTDHTYETWIDDIDKDKPDFVYYAGNN